MWTLRPTDEYSRRLRQFSKKHPRELQAMLDNLDTYLQTLQAGVHPRQVRHGFTHDETHGAIAIDQKGTKGKPTQTRLYVLPRPGYLDVVSDHDRGQEVSTGRQRHLPGVDRRPAGRKAECPRRSGRNVRHERAEPR